MKPRIAILFAGGTIGMVEDPSTGFLRPVRDTSSILELFPGLRKKISPSFFPLFNIDSSNMTPNHWQIIANKINELYDQFDGFVVLQGTDTMAFTASALSFALRDLSKPVIFTGSIVPLSELGADARNNFIYACLVAAMDIAEVCILFGYKIIRGCRAKKNHESFVDVFHSPNFPLLGEIERPIQLHEWRKKRRKRGLKFHAHFESNIRLIKMFPGLNPISLDRMVEGGAKGLIIEGFGPGNLPFMDNSIFPTIEKAIKNNIPVIITSQMENGVTNLHAYEAGYKALQIGAVGAGDMTIEATVTKLMWILSKTNELPKIKSLMEEDIAGERSAKGTE